MAARLHRPLSAVLSVALAASASRCAPSLRRFPLRAALWTDTDTRPIPRPPEEYWSPLIWDAADHMVFRPVTRGLALEVGREAVNVNAFDEVPDSSWYANRLALHPMSVQDAALGACAGQAPPPAGPWTITAAKPNGFFPGFIVRGPDGRRYVLKADGDAQPQQTSGADVIGSRIYYAAGYFAPCNRVLHIARGDLRIAPDATVEDALGHKHPMAEHQVDAVLAKAFHEADGRYRLGMSLFVDGRPIGPFTYEGTRHDDPNDVIPHEDRRDLRGSRLLAAWLNHFDAREQNTLTTWITVPSGGGFVRHYFLDFGDCLGGVWPADGMSRRVGHSGYADLPHIAEDFISLGLIDRPWDHSQVDAVAWPFGYYRVADFDPAGWRDGYPNPAFDRMTERDGAWMARIVARFSDAHLRAIVEQAEFSLPAFTEYATRVLAGRRDRILARYLTRVSPLADFTVSEGRLCAADRAVEAGLYRGARYAARLRYAGDQERAEPLALVTEGARVCTTLPAANAPDGGLADDAPARYRVIELASQPRAGDARIARAHLYDLGQRRGYQLVGIER